MIKIIDNKKVEMTQDEWELYVSICRSYDRPNFKGEDLFSNTFETDDNGIILFIRPSSEKYTSMEVLMFMCSIFSQQHTRLMYNELEKIKNQFKEKIKELDEKIASLNK